MNTPDTLEQLVSGAKRPAPVSQQELEESRMRVQKLHSINAGLLGMEQSVRVRLVPELNTALNRLAALKTQTAAEAAGYKVLDLGPFSYRRPNGTPALAIFSLNHPVCKFSSGFIEETNARMFPRVPPKIEACYEDVFVMLSAQRATKIGQRNKRNFRRTACYLAPTIVSLVFALITKNNLWCSGLVFAVPTLYFFIEWFGFAFGDSETKVLFTEFDAAVPDSARESIRKAGKIFGSNNVYIVAEVTKWNSKLERNDPLVTGWDGENLWLVDSFFPTSLEKLIEGKFTSSV